MPGGLHLLGRGLLIKVRRSFRSLYTPKIKILKREMTSDEFFS